MAEKMADIHEIYDKVIFDSECQTIVNTVNCVGIMGTGLALEFKNRFPDMFAEYQALCKNEQLKPGILHLYKQSEPWILNFPTKHHWRHPSKIEYINQGLSKFAQNYMKRGIVSIAFPKLGTQAGGLEWSVVRKLMWDHLQPLPNLDVEVYHFSISVEDRLFKRLKGIIHEFSEDDLVKIIGLSNKQACLVSQAIRDPESKNMMAIQGLRGIGKETVSKIYRFANRHKTSSVYEKGEQVELFK